MNRKYITLLLIPLFLSALSTASCKKKKEHPMIDMESIEYDGSMNEKYIFRDELKKEQEKKQKLEKLQKEEMDTKEHN